MTPEERSHAAWNAFTSSVDLLEMQHVFERAVYNAVRAAVLAERLACIEIAESFIPSGFRDGTKGGDLVGIARDDRARTIAEAIRQRT